MSQLTVVAQAVDNLLPWQQYICNACGYIYNEADGDPDSGLPPGTRFVDIPDDWACPLCGVTKSDFSLYTPTTRSTPQSTAGTPRPAQRGGTRSQPGVVIVGAGRAGWQLVEALRAIDPGMPITLVTACPGHIYDKPLLSVALARQLDAQKLVREMGDAAAKRLNVRLLANTHAIRICADTQQLRTTRGSVAYTHLVLAHGAQPALPPSLPAALCWRVNHLQAYLQLRAALGQGVTAGPKDVVIVGAGLVGTELANDLALGGHRITLLDIEPEPLARWHAQQAGPQLLQAWTDLPIRFVGEVRVARVEKLEKGYRVSTECGQRFDADQVIAATGLKTPGRLALSAGLSWRDGIAVQTETLRTSNARIYALGDCISIDGQASRFIEPITRQARAIAADICAKAPEPFENRSATVRVKTSSRPLSLH